MAKIILCRGIQNSGKTTFAKQWVLEDPEHRVRFNNDDIRNMLGKYWVPSREPIVKIMKSSFISGAAIFCKDFVITTSSRCSAIIIINTYNSRIKFFQKAYNFITHFHF